jgi:hypothetical protein
MGCKSQETVPRVGLDLPYVSWILVAHGSLGIVVLLPYAPHPLSQSLSPRGPKCRERARGYCIITSEAVCCDHVASRILDHMWRTSCLRIPDSRLSW